MGDDTLRELVYGKGAHVDPVACVEDISAEVAARTVAGYPHSVWQIVEHMNYWMDFELRKIAGEVPKYPEKAMESWPPHSANASGGHPSEAQWSAFASAFCGIAGAVGCAGRCRFGNARQSCERSGCHEEVPPKLGARHAVADHRAQ